MQYSTGNFYHIYNRGINKNKIFYKRNNYLYFIGLIRKYLEKYRTSIISYRLIPDHYHLLLYQKSYKSLSKSIQTLNNTFVQAMNKQVNRKGTLFEGRAKAKLIKI